MFVNLVCWIAVGLIAGFAVSKFVDQRGDDPKLGLVLAAAGAAVGGFAYSLMFGPAGVNAFNTGGLWAALVGALVAVAAWNLIRGRASRA
jgi:uncharacterized membrane protein YeaQ/YmgE (transglycosylase-associated protein family)